MSILREWGVRLLGALRPRAEDDLLEELRSHLELAVEEARREGPSLEEAARTARVRTGGTAQAMEALRDQRGLPWLSDLSADLRHSCRVLASSPGFTAVVVLTLAVGIGANTAVFTVADALWLRPPPFERASGLHWIVDVNDSLGVTVNSNMYPSPGNFVDWRSESRSFDHMSAWQNWFFSIANSDGHDPVAEQVRGVSVSPSFFRMLGVEAVLGRTFRPDEEEPGRDRVVVMADRLWKRRFGADPDAIGKAVLVDGRPYTIVGVLPADFGFLEPDFEMWIPLTIDGGVRSLRSSHSISVLARLAPQVGLAEAQADIDRIARNLERAHPATNDGWGARLRPVFPFNTELRPTLLMLLSAVGCVLLIACVNVANLVLVRVGGRRQEIAIRAAVGASRSRLVRHIVAESVLLAGLGAVSGVWLAVWSLNILRPLIPQVRVSGPLTLAVDLRVLLFTLAAAGLTSVAFGLLPALRGTRKAHLRVTAPLARQTRLGRVLSVGEIALSLMLLVAATLLIRSLWNLQRVDPGFEPEGLLTMQVWLPETRYASVPEVSGFHQEVLRRLDGFPEIAAAAFVNTRPFLGWSLGAALEIPGRPVPDAGDRPIAGCRIISPEYFSALGTPLVRGRILNDSDGPTSQAVALVNESLANRYWPTEDPIGQSIRATSLGSTSGAPWWPEQMTDTFTIVGVVRDIREGRLRDQAEPTVYLSYLQNPSRYMHILVRTASTSPSAAQLVQREIRAVDADLGVYDVRSMDAVLRQAVAEPRFNSLLLWVFAGVALLLSAIGVYGVTSYAVMQRTREFALRVALGAESRAIARLVARDGLVVALTGITIGLVGALVLGRLLTTLLYGVVRTDMWTLVGSASAVLAVALLACWRPARRATAVDPMTVFRAE